MASNPMGPCSTVKSFRPWRAGIQATEADQSLLKNQEHEAIVLPGGVGLEVKGVPYATPSAAASAALKEALTVGWFGRPSERDSKYS